MRQEQDNSSKKRDWRLLALAGGMFVLAACVSGGLYSQRQAAQSAPAEADEAARPKPRMIADISPEVKTQFVEHAKMLREKWRPWAQKHQAELKRMLQAAPGDLAAMVAVWDAVPANPMEVGFTSKELMPTGDPFTGVGFGWAAQDKELGKVVPAPQSAAMLQKMAAMVGPQKRHEFETHRDLVIAGGGMRTETTLWAGGRIMQRSLLPPEEHIAIMRKAADEKRGLNSDDLWAPAQEMVPPYDFLSSS